MLVIDSPISLRLEGYEDQRRSLNALLTYQDNKADWEYKKFKQNRWYARKYGPEAYLEKLEELKGLRKKNLVFEDEKGLWTYSGMRNVLRDRFDDTIRCNVNYPEPRPVPWAKRPPFELRYYQEEIVTRMLAEKHAGVEVGTGLGKTAAIIELLRRLGLQAVIMAPSTNIAEQIHEQLLDRFGKAKVGFVGDGKKQYDKLFTVGIAASLTRIEQGSKAWELLSKAQVFIADESHLCPATTLAKVCFGLVGNAPYRFFFSGTQMRSDGLDMVLDGITGPIVYKMTVQEGVDQKFLAKPEFRMVWTKSTVVDRDGNPYYSQDANELTRAHVFYNPDVAKKAANIANMMVQKMGRPTVILVDEFEQFAQILPYLKGEVRFAHGGVTKENKGKIPAQYHDSDPKKLVEAFNAGEFPILVGTSCIVTGTDIKAVQAILFLRGGKSEVEIKQSVGRGTRLVGGKTDCLFIDFGIENVPTLERHATARKAVYDEIYPSYSEMRL